MPAHGDLPSLRAAFKLGAKNSTDNTCWYDVKFYPYTPPRASPVFAVTGGCNTVICRCVHQKENHIEILRWFKDEDADANYVSVEWSRATNGDPLVCVTGGMSTAEGSTTGGKVKVFNVRSGELVTTLAGHGDEVVDLAVSPIDPTILASASYDNSVRIWTLDPAFQRQPTAAIVFGEGHKEGCLTIGFHRNGQYLLSGGMDTRLNLWLIPENIKQNLGTDRPLTIHYPYFSSTEIHTDYIDCVTFHNDIIISRAAQEDRILIWRIDNFNSDAPPPSSVPMPQSNAIQSSTTTYIPSSQVSDTRSAWGGRFQRLLQLKLPEASFFYIRFNLFQEEGKHPVLAAGNLKSRVFFWDLKKLEDMSTTATPEEPKPSKKKGKKAVSELLVSRTRENRENTEASETSNASSAAQGNGSGPGTLTTGAMGKKKGRTSKEDKNAGIGDAFKSIPAHKSIMVPRMLFTYHQIAWSTGGEWCVGCGSHGMIAVMGRWEDGFPEPAP